MIGRRTVTPDCPYAPYNENGTDYVRDSGGNRRWKNVIEMLTELVADEGQTAEERDRAAECLRFYEQWVRYAVEHPDRLDVTVARMMGEGDVELMWHSPEDAIIRTHDDGYQYVVSKKFHGREGEVTVGST